jgi:hypothetical protein
MLARSIIGAVCVCFGLTFSSCISAAPLSYDEVISGDISDTTLDPIFNFDIGSNTISGSTEYSLSNVDTDNFWFALPVGSELVSIRYEFYNLNLLPNTHTLSSGYNLYNDNYSDLGYINVSVINDISPILFLASYPIGEGEYLLTSSAVWDGDGGSWNYTWIFEVNTVPIPGAVWLFGSGLIGLIGIARRKKS